VKNLIGRCHHHPKFHQGLSPLITLETGFYEHKKYGRRGKPVLKIVGWANPDGTATAETPRPDFNDALPGFA
jgi:hypothetical protein